MHENAAPRRVEIATPPSPRTPTVALDRLPGVCS